MNMTKKKLEAIGRLLEAAVQTFNDEEANQDKSQRTPVHEIKPGLYLGYCKTLGIDDESTYTLAAFALGLVAGMAEEPAKVTALPGGGELTVALESLRVKMNNNRQ